MERTRRRVATIVLVVIFVGGLIALVLTLRQRREAAREAAVIEESHRRLERAVKEAWEEHRGEREPEDSTAIPIPISILRREGR